MLLANENAARQDDDEESDVMRRSFSRSSVSSLPASERVSQAERRRMRSGNRVELSSLILISSPSLLKSSLHAMLR